MILKRFTLEQFNELAENAHLICFNEVRPRHLNRFNFALMVEDEAGVPLAYATCIETDAESIYMQHGGAFPSSSKGPLAVRAYHMMLKYLKEHYRQSSTIIRNTNIAMIKMAYSAGFVIHGIDYMEDGIYLHLLNVFKGEENVVGTSSNGCGVDASKREPTEGTA